MKNILVFDIETIPDIESAKKLYEFQQLSDSDIANALFTMRRQQTHGSEFLQHYLQKIVAISIVLYSNNEIKVRSLGEIDATEADIIAQFYKGLDYYTPTLVSWNGNGFDLPVLHYRTLLHKISAPRYWETGEDDSAFRWNNYLNRYHERHLDLMDVLAGYSSKAFAPLDSIATMLNLPGKMGMSGSKVWDAYLNNELKAIRDYCEADVLNTFIVYLHFQLMRGKLHHQQLDEICQQTHAYLASHEQPHLRDFAAHWQV